jgi:hypothetical protein
VDAIGFGTNGIRPVRSQIARAFPAFVFVAVAGCSWPQPKSASPAQAAKTSKAIWKELEIEMGSSPIPFETAKTTAQLSLIQK